MERLKLEQYQEFCKQNWGPGCGQNPLYFPLGLAGECGEVCEEIKKATRDLRPIDKEKLSKECGDVMWYLANICNIHGVSLQEVIEKNKAKLDERHGGTYKANRSDSDVFYMLKGPHIEMVEKKTGKHIKFCKKAEVPKEVLEKLKNSTPIYIMDPADKLPWED